MNVPFQFSLPFGSLTGERTRGAAQQFQAPQMVSTWPRTIILGMMFAMVAAVGWVDYAGGLELSVSLLYLVPITIVTWVAGRAMGYTAALASAGVWLAADLLAGHAYGHWIVPLWNTFTLAISFLVVAELLGSLREVNGSLEQIVTRRTRALLDENAQRRRAEEELCDALSNVRKSHAQLRQTQFKLIEAAKMESVARLAAGVAHEVKNPLMTLSLGADYFLSRKTENPDEAQLAQDMKEAVYRASNVINILLDYSRPGPLQRGTEDIHEVIEKSLTLVRYQLNKQHVTVVREFDTTLPPQLLDRTRIEQVFVNLFLNAAQAMPAGGTLMVRTLAAPLASDSDTAAGAVVEVDDTGHGIRPENAPKLFEPFFTTKPPGQGTGLGLAIVRRIMEIHGGSIRLSNRKEGGARATLQFNDNSAIPRRQEDYDNQTNPRG